MTKKMTQNPAFQVLSLTAFIMAAGSAQAYDLTLSSNMPPITVHGFASQGFLLSSDYDYLANDTKNGSFQLSEVGLNVSMNPFPRTRIAVQGFDFDVGNVGQYDPFLDYALVEYTACDEIGIRAGRIRRPAGIYNSIQDIDLARTFVLLPQGIYDARWRDWSAGLDGGELFGDIQLPTHKLGDISYEVYAGMVSMQENGGVARYIADADYINVDTMVDNPIYGIQLWYNTPLDGLRFGASFAYMNAFGFTANTVKEVPVAANVYIPVNVAIQGSGDVVIQQYSAEYLWRKWTFQAEYYTYDLTGHGQNIIMIPGSPITTVSPIGDNPDAWYGAVSYRINKHVQVGTYYSDWMDGGLKQDDLALCLRLDLTDWWIFKIEGHYLEGTGLLRDAADNPHVDNNSGWFMLALKTTVSF
jgi:hypothetical protein